MTGTDESAASDREEHAHRVLQCFQASHDRIVRWLETKTGSRAIALDIANETFVELLELKNPVRDLTPYAYRVASNILADRRTTEATHSRLNVRLVTSAESDTPSPEPAIAAAQESSAIHTALNELPPRAREALRLRFWEELSYAEIVDQFRARGIVVTTRTVMRWVADAMVVVREALEPKDGQ